MLVQALFKKLCVYNEIKELTDTHVQTEQFNIGVMHRAYIGDNLCVIILWRLH